MKVRSTFALIAFSLIEACATPPAGAPVVSDASALSTIQSRHQQELNRLQPGMSANDFRAVFPQAVLAAQNGEVTAHEVSEVVNYVSPGDMTRQNIIWGAGSPRPRSVRQALWFYFASDRLVKWGGPQEWPTSAELETAAPQ